MQRRPLDQAAELFLGDAVQLAFLGIKVWHGLVFNSQPLPGNDAEKLVVLFPNLALLQMHQAFYGRKRVLAMGISVFIASAPSRPFISMGALTKDGPSESSGAWDADGRVLVFVCVRAFQR